jgi:AcrR family transcriptional regulator
MARPKEFERADALRAGIDVFWRQGFASTTTEDLARAMGIGRQSFYDTFGDKRRCFLEALRTYSRENIERQLAEVSGIASPLEALRELLRMPAQHAVGRRSLGCMAVNSLAEFGAEDPEVAAALAPSSTLLEESVARLVRDAREKRELPWSLDERRAVNALLCTRVGLMLSARSGQSPEALRKIADFTIDQLTRR